MVNVRSIVNDLNLQVELHCWLSMGYFMPMITKRVAACALLC